MISWWSLHWVSWNPWISRKSLEIIDFHWFQWLWWWLASSRVRNVLPKPDRTWKFVSNFLKRLGKVHFRGGNNFPIVWSRDLVSSCDDRYLEYLEIYGFHPNPWLSRICKLLHVIHRHTLLLSKARVLLRLVVRGGLSRLVGPQRRLMSTQEVYWDQAYRTHKRKRDFIYFDYSDPLFPDMVEIIIGIGRLCQDEHPK